MNPALDLIESSEENVLTKVTVEWLLEQLTEEEREILTLWVVENLSFDHIGQIVGPKYKGKIMKGTTVRYRKDKIMKKLRQYRAAAGAE